jgi:hypothetical protein
MDNYLIMGTISVTSPIGTWNYNQVLGAKVRIRHLPVCRGLFGYDSDETYKITEIMFRVSADGKSICNVFLEGIDEPFEWKDLEILSLGLVFFDKAICSLDLCCGTTLCGWNCECEDTDEDNSNTTTTEHVCEDGPVLD